MLDITEIRFKKIEKGSFRRSTIKIEKRSFRRCINR